jgi:NAD(P)-dependent dehydrogenase (short-subunit alcohol dehydrogenase family)
MQGRVCLITGSTSGIGRVAAEQIASMGAILCLVGRDRGRAERTVEEIRSGTGNDSIGYLLADLSVQSEVRRLASEFRSRHARLHVLVNNAGATFGSRRESRDGIEMTFALNHLAYLLLTNLLLDLLKASAPARIINVSSGAHQRATLDFADLQNQRRYRGMRVYGQSKLCNLYLTYELAERLRGTGVTVNALHPGFVATNFGRSDNGLMGAIMPLAHRFALSPQRGAETLVYLASSPNVESITGQYFFRKRPVRSSPASYDLDARRRLWAISETMAGMRPAAKSKPETSSREEGTGSGRSAG